MAVNQNVTQLTQQTTTDTTSLFYAVGASGTTDTGLPLSVLHTSPAFTGIPTVPTAAVNTSTTQVASTAYVVNQGYLTVTTAASTYAIKGANTFTATQTILDAAPALNLNDSSGAGSSRVTWLNNGTNIWSLVNDTTSGKITLNRYVSGTLTDTPLAVANATGITTFTQRPIFGANTPWDSGNLVSPAVTTNPLSQFAATTSAQLAGIVSDETGTGALVFAGSPTFTGTVSVNQIAATGAIAPSQTAGLTGTTTNNNANSGSVGEYITATGTAVSLTSVTPANITSISLTAGDWDVSGNVSFVPAGTTVLQSFETSINTITATHAAIPFNATVSGIIIGAGANNTQIPPIQRISVATTTTVFLVATAVFVTSTLTASGYIRARRVR